MKHRADSWVSDYVSESGLNILQHRGGVEWSKAPLPRRLHSCHAQTRGFLDDIFVEWCACGGIRMEHGRWMERNSRRRNAG